MPALEEYVSKLIKLNCRSKEKSRLMIFKITDEMKSKITKWDSCSPVDVTGAKFSYSFTRTSLGLVIQVHCDICNRKLDLTEGWLE